MHVVIRNKWLLEEMSSVGKAHLQREILFYLLHCIIDRPMFEIFSSMEIFGDEIPVLQYYSATELFPLRSVTLKKKKKRIVSYNTDKMKVCLHN